jgi:hypothetical protein
VPLADAAEQPRAGGNGLLHKYESLVATGVLKPDKQQVIPAAQRAGAAQALQ